MFVGELPTMDEPEGIEDLDYAFHNNFSGHGERTVFAIEECLELFGNQSNFPLEISCLDHAPVLTESTVIKSLILSVMAILSLLGNVATMLSIKKSKRQRSAHIYTLIYHLSIADLFVTFWCILGDAIWSLTVEWMAGNVECKIFKFCQMSSLYLSTFIMVLIGVDRFIAVKYPLKSMRKGLCFKLIAVCWVCSAVLSLPQMVIFHVKQGPFIEEFYQCVTYGFYTAEWQEHVYTVFTLVCGFLLPLAILMTTYGLTVLTLRRNEEILDHTGTFQTLIDPNRRKLLRRAKMKSLRISVAIVVAFLVCWTPYYVMMMYFLFFVPNKDALISDEVYSGIFFFGMSNSLFNPVIYGVFHLWKPARKDLQRGNSSRRTYLTSLSFQRQRSSGTLTGSLLSRNLDGVSHAEGNGTLHNGGSHHANHHHHLHRNSTGGISSKDSVRTMNTSISNRDRERFMNRKNSSNQSTNKANLQNHNSSSPLTNGSANQIQNPIKPLPIHECNGNSNKDSSNSPNSLPAESVICICNQNQSNQRVIENHV